MSEFHKDQIHQRFAVLFDSCKIEEIFKPYNIRYSIVKDREEARLNSMLNSAGQMGASFVRNQTSAIECVAIAHSQEEAAAMH